MTQFYVESADKIDRLVLCVSFHPDSIHSYSRFLWRPGAFLSSLLSLTAAGALDCTIGRAKWRMSRTLRQAWTNKTIDGRRAAVDQLQARPSTLRAMVAIVIGGIAICGIAGPASAAGTFSAFAGAWKGAGTLAMTDGSRAAIRCKADYAVNEGGDAMNIDVDCASDSYRVNIVASVVAQGTSLSGQWQETTRQAQGSVTGQVPRPGELQASLEGTGFGLQLSTRTEGRQQIINVRSEGADVQGATIKLRR